MPYKVTYTTKTLPTDLPDGAEVEDISLLPLSFETDAHDVPVTVGRRGYLTVLVVDSRVAELTDREATIVRDALDESLGQSLIEPGHKVRRLTDDEHMHWYEFAPDRWTAGLNKKLAKDNLERAVADLDDPTDMCANWTLDEIRESYGIASTPRYV